MLRKIIVLLSIAVMMSVLPAYAVDDKTIDERIAQLEMQKAQLEAALIGTMARIEELKRLKQENTKQDGTPSDKSEHREGQQ